MPQSFEIVTKRLSMSVSVSMFSSSFANLNLLIILLFYRLLHKTLPRSIALRNWISVRFYKTCCTLTYDNCLGLGPEFWIYGSQSAWPPWTSHRVQGKGCCFNVDYPVWRIRIHFIWPDLDPFQETWIRFWVSKKSW